MIAHSQHAILQSADPSDFGSRGSRNLYWLISPYGLSVISLVPLALSLLISRDLYERYAEETCLMCDSIWMPIFCLLCTACFVIGAMIHRAFHLPKPPPTHLKIAEVKRAEMLFVSFGLLALGLLNVASFLIILSNTSGLVGLLLSGGGAIAKGAINTEGSFSQVQPLLIYYNAYALARYFQARGALPSFARHGFVFILSLSILLTILIAIAKVARYEIIPVICSLAFVFAEHKARTQNLRNSTLVWYILFTLAAVVLVFTFFSIFRGFTELEDIIGTLIGYGPASYNHLVALLNGELTPTFAGSGVYAFPFIGHIPLFESIFHFTEIFGIPSAESTFIAEFFDTERAGLNSMYIWLTMSGYLYADLGFGTFAFMLLYGYFASNLFSSYRHGDAAGAFLYPMIFVAMILNFSFNVIFRPSTIAILAIALIITEIERAIRQLYGSYQ